MSYLNRLARRIAGLSQGNSLQPNVRCWSAPFDPFENTVVIQSPAYPDTSSRQQRPETHTVSAREDALIPRQHHQTIRSAKKTNIKTVGESTRLDERKQLRSVERITGTKAESTEVTHLPKQRPFLKQPGKAAQRDVTGNENSPVNESKASLFRQQSVTIPQQRTENDGLEAIKVSGSTLFHRLADKADASRQVTTKSRPAVQQGRGRTVTTKGLEIVTPHLQNIDPSNRISPASLWSHRRKPPAAKTEVAPRLIIKSLKVDVVPVTDKVKQRPAAHKTARTRNEKRNRDISRQAAKMRFGLGQM